MKIYAIVKADGNLWNPIKRLHAPNFDKALAWCLKNGFDLIEELND